MLHDLIYLLVGLAAAPVVLVRRAGRGKLRTDWRGRRGHASVPAAPDRRTVLVHGVSVGEVSAARRLVDLLEGDAAAGVRVVVSSTTDTGVARAEALYGGRCPVVRFPFDLSWMIRRFLDAVRPDAIVIVELELWPNLLAEAEARDVPVLVVNGRMTESSHRGLLRVRPVLGSMFRRVCGVDAQSPEDAERFVSLGVPAGRVRVTDSMKWDAAPDGAVAGAERLRRALGIDPGRPLVVAGSTGPGEERLLIRTRPEGVQLLLAPRKPERFDEVADLVSGMPRRSVRPDAVVGGAPSDAAQVRGPDVFLLDSMGELDEAYALADVAVVGRSFVPMGGSDPAAPAALGRAVVMGPHHAHFARTVAALVEAGALVVTESPMEAVTELLADPDRLRSAGERGRALVRARRGASARAAERVVAMLEGGGKL